MTLCFSHLLSFLICISFFLLALKMVIMPCCCYYHYSQFMAMKKKYFLKRSVLSNAMDSSKFGLGLIAEETARVTNPKKDPGGIGFIDEIGGGVDGLMSCTESLGFESCDERRVDDDHDVNNDGMMMVMRRKRSEEKRAERNKKFPPPLSSLNQNGQPCFYLKPVRKNGRLELTEVRIQRPEILRAVRENGRLRLYLVSSNVCLEKENEESKHEEEPEQDLHLPAEEEEDLWKYRINGEDYRRCHAHEMVVSHHHHHHMNEHHSLRVWRQPCVTR